MKTRTNTAEAKIVYGKKVNPPMKYDWTWEDYETLAEMEADKKGLTEEEMLKFRNDQIEGKARSAAFTVAAQAAGYVKPTAENSGLVRLKDAERNMLACKLKDGVTPKYTPEQARKLAEDITGESWADFEE